MSKKLPISDQSWNEDIFQLLQVIDKNEDLNGKDGNEFDDNDQMNLGDEKDMIEQDCENDVDSIYNTNVINDLDDKSDGDNSSTKEITERVHYICS